MPVASAPPSQNGAIFDVTGHYRYILWRQWQPGAPRIVFVMLNPSTADAVVNDPTLHRCLGFAQSWGYGALEVVNLFAYRTAKPYALKQTVDPVGEDNDRYITAAADRAATLVFAWGNCGRWHGRDRQVLALLADHPQVCCLGINQSGQPRHPLYVKGDTAPLPFSPYP